MIQIFDIKKRKKNLKENDVEILRSYLDESKINNDEDLIKYNTSLNGLKEEDALSRLNDNGKNIVIKENNKTPLYFLLMAFKDEFIIILLVLAMINFLLGDKLGSIIIVIIAFISALIRFFQDYSVYKFNKKLKNSIYSVVNVIRNGKEKEIRIENVVVGDIVKLNAGTIIPADLKIIESKDLFVNQSVFTGESTYVEKKNINKTEAKEIFDIENICLMGTSVIIGSGTGIVI